MGEWLEQNRSNLAAVLVVLATVAGVALLQIPRRPALQLLPPTPPATPPSIKVHVTGAVQSPGVYSIEVDARVEDAVKAAGGTTEAADLIALNLATPLRDGQQLVVPEKRTAASIPAAASPPGAYLPPGTASQPSPTPPSAKLDLNSANQKQLEALPGIGPVTAQKILDYRQKNGRFVSVQELKDAKLVNSPTFEKVKELVDVQ
ncbi:MAG: helix-hairpin-helix domain-containing protein [Chloroflexota bacterium]|jgi:competence protein ComEA